MVWDLVGRCFRIKGLFGVHVSGQIASQLSVLLPSNGLLGAVGAAGVSEPKHTNHEQQEP